jgi:hypothetical protein
VWAFSDKARAQNCTLMNMTNVQHSQHPERSCDCLPLAARGRTRGVTPANLLAREETRPSVSRVPPYPMETHEGEGLQVRWDPSQASDGRNDRHVAGGHVKTGADNLTCHNRLVSGP